MSKTICFIVAIPGTAQAFLSDHIRALSKEYNVFLVANSELPDAMKDLPLSGYHVVKIERGISLWNDLKGVLALKRYFKDMHFDAVHSVTPKAGLLTALAGFLARVPVRVHIFTGQVWANKTGFSRWLLKFMDKIIARLNTHILVDGEGQRQYLIQNGVVLKEKSQVLGKGSICGVNLERFSPSSAVREAIRSELKIESDKIVFVFMGRLNHDKGLYELLPAFNRLAGERDNVYLLLVGRDEENVASHFSEYGNIIPDKNFCFYGLTNEPQKLLQAGDVFVLPTYREGFGSSVIEASALGLPVICSDAYGVMDAMVDNVTGLRCKVGDVESLNNAMSAFVDDPGLISQLGIAGHERVKVDFNGKEMSRLWVKFYQEIFAAE